LSNYLIKRPFYAPSKRFSTVIITLVSACIGWSSVRALVENIVWDYDLVRETCRIWFYRPVSFLLMSVAKLPVISSEVRTRTHLEPWEAYRNIAVLMY